VTWPSGRSDYENAARLGCDRGLQRRGHLGRQGARAFALGTLPLEPSQAVRQGRGIEARPASSCCDSPVRLRAARNMPPVISTIVMLRILCVASAYVNVSVLYQFVDTANRSWPTSITLAAGISFGRAARGSVALRKMACRSAAGECAFAVQGHQRALRRGSPVAALSNLWSLACASAPRRAFRRPSKRKTPQRRPSGLRGLIDTSAPSAGAPACDDRLGNRPARSPLRCRSDLASKATTCLLDPRLIDPSARQLPRRARSVAASSAFGP
jgi:hypothetical protein